MNEQQRIDLETRLAFQEDALRQLNEALVGQQSRVADLERLCRMLAERLSRLGDGTAKGSVDDEVPPHY